MLFRSKYFRRFGYIYHPDYKALWCDNEFTEVADAFGKQTYFDDIIIRHEHPIWGYGQQDELNNRDNRLYQDDKQTYLRRKSAGFGIEPAAIEHLDSDAGITKGDVQQVESGDRPANKRKRGRPARSGGQLVGRSSVIDRGEKK